MTVTSIPLTATPTMQPTSNAPTSGPTTPKDTNAINPELGEFPVSGQVSLHLQGITNPISGDTRLLFLAMADEFIASYSIGTVEDIRVMLIYQKAVATKDDTPNNLRFLQEGSVLRVDLGVEGLAYEETFSASDWNNWLKKLFDQSSPEFVTMLQELGTTEGNTFFDDLDRVKVAEPEPIVRPSPAPAPQEPMGDEGVEDNGIPLLAIIGAAVGGFLFLINSGIT